MDKIRIGISDYEESSNGDISDSHSTLTVMNLYSEPLIRLYDGKIWPALAQSWQSFDDGHRWLFYLRPNIMFHDSTPCSVVDVIDSFEEIKSQSTKTGMPSPYERYFSALNFRIINRLTLEVTCETPCGDVAEILSGINIRRTKHNEKPVIGTGNYTFAKFYAGKTVRLEKRSGLKHLSAYDQITFHIIPDPEERLAALKEGKIHFAANLEQLPRQKQDPDFTWWKCVSSKSTVGLLNAFEPPFNDPRARIGINYAVDVDQIIHEVFSDLAIPAATIGSPFHCGYDNSIKPVGYDPEKAKQLFEKVAMPSQLEIFASEGFPPRSREIAAFIAEQLDKIHIQTSLHIIEDETDYLRLIEKKQAGHIALFHSASNSTYRILSECVSSTEKGRWWQGYTDEKTQSLILAANTEDDITNRERKYSAVLNHLNQQPPWLYLFHPISVYACLPEVKDVELLHTEMLRFPGSW